MGYSIDLSSLSIQNYKEHLLSIDLLPSRRILLDAIDARFSAIAECGIKNLRALMQALSTPSKMADFCSNTHIPQEYLTILKREIGSLVPKSVALTEFDMLSQEAADTLRSAGYRNSKDFFEAYPYIDESVRTTTECDKLYQLCGLVRVNGIGALAAKIFFEAGYATVDDIASAHPKVMAEKVNEVNSVKKYYDGQRLGIKDMSFCIVHAKMLQRYS